ncbi:Hypothetical predicted protein [Marmota monax]|uniref:Uncharacterized protein n=1 Tax=Marmota monax TaxID=9995 RepID=A0A5E4BY07_MARMO|nr:Hypothetical predicted protein [Marmota monax]
MDYCYGTKRADQEIQPGGLSLYERKPESIENFELSSGFILDMGMAQEKMEVDLELPPNSTTSDGNALRIANSVPLINGFGDNSQLFLPSPIRTSASRLHQIKQEEGMDVVNKEAMHEREVHTAIQISQSWEDSLNLNDDDLDTPSTVKSIDLIPVSQAASLTKWIGKIKYHLMISQDTANIHPVTLPSCQ